MKKKIYIISADEIILYQPTILNLYDSFLSDFEPIIITFEPSFLGKSKDITRNVQYITYKNFTSKIIRLIELPVNAVFKRISKVFPSFKLRLQLIRKYKAQLLYNSIKNISKEVILAVDLMPLFVAQKTNNKICFLSLEIITNDTYLNRIENSKIECVIIQNVERFNYLFPTTKPTVFYVQNAPKLNTKVTHQNTRNNLLWAGTITKEFGVLNCVEFVKKYPQYKLVLKGASALNTKEYIEKKYANLIQQDNLEINTTYLDANEFVKFISTHKIGFCFYDWNLINANFNYQTAPSGKLFMYLAAGVPVIVCNIIGFKFIEENNAGVLINDYKVETILAAVKKIEANYQQYSQNAYKTFENTCFDVNIGTVLNFLKQL
jgi:glycosyltransferase involved in cell wall biosynthesis